MDTAYERRNSKPFKIKERNEWPAIMTIPNTNPGAPLLADAIPGLALELETLLAKDGEAELALQIRHLSIVDRCRCGDDFCATFYTVSRPNGGAWGSGHRNISLDCDRGMLILDVVDDKITCVEVLYRDEVRQRMHEILP